MTTLSMQIFSGLTKLQDYFCEWRRSLQNCAFKRFSKWVKCNHILIMEHAIQFCLNKIQSP